MLYKTQQQTLGIIVTIDMTPEFYGTDTGTITVLWSVAPEESDYVKFVLPIVRRAHQHLTPSKLINLQPMPVPVEGIFYMNYTYGESKLDKRCKEGSLPSKILWRTVRCLRIFTLRSWSSLCSSFRWASGKRCITVGSPSDAQAKKALIEQWTKKSG